jgi:hypothetical protein
MLKKTPAIERGASKRAPDKKHAAVAAHPFDYTNEQWAEIRQSLQHLKLDPARIDEACMCLQEIVTAYFCDKANRPDRKVAQQTKRFRQKWARISKLSVRLSEELDAVRGPWPIREIADKLSELRMMADKRTRFASFKLTGCVLGIGANPQIQFRFRVLKIWTNLGGQLGISRHPLTGKVKGPLAKYFAAVTQPVIGGSLETLPDAIERQKRAIEKWRTGRGRPIPPGPLH